MDVSQYVAGRHRTGRAFFNFAQDVRREAQWSGMNKHIGRVSPHEMDYYPFFIDYDFVKLRPRGGSACIDFFASGKLCAVVDSVGTSEIIYVRKGNIAPEMGFFLMDFALAAKAPNTILEALKGMNITELYLEDSQKHSLQGIFAKNPDFKLTMVSFAK